VLEEPRNKRRLIAVLVLGIYCTFPARGQAPAASEQTLAAGRAALQQHLYGKAIHVLEEGLKSFPDASNANVKGCPCAVEARARRRSLSSRIRTSHDVYNIPVFRSVILEAAARSRENASSSESSGDH
jgi:hypothetical protein